MSRSGASAKLAGLVVLSFVAGCASGGGAAGGGGAAAAVTATPEMIAQGQTIFAASCARCHGPSGANGEFGPNLADDEWLWVTNPSGPNAMTEVANVIRNGVTTPRAPESMGMPPMGGGNLTDAQINALAAYILSL